MYGSFNFNHARGWEMTMRQKLTMCVVEFLAHFHVRVRECARTGTFLLLGIDDDQLVMKVIAILNDSAVLKKMKSVLFPEKLSNEIRDLRETILSFQKKLDEKSQHIIMLETKISGLECKIDDIEQYGRISNLERVHRWVERRTPFDRGR